MQNGKIKKKMKAEHICFFVCFMNKGHLFFFPLISQGEVLKESTQSGFIK